METSPTTGQSEQSILWARRSGGLSCEESFRQLYQLYGRNVLSWLLVRLPRDHAEDLFQDVWTTFLVRWRDWDFRHELAAPEARPVLSFLFQTAAFMWKGHLRKDRRNERLSEQPELDPADPRDIEAHVELGRCLDLAAKICTEQEIEVLVGRLSGLSGAEMAHALGTSEHAVDHRYRDAIARLRQHLQLQGIKQ